MRAWICKIIGQPLSWDLEKKYEKIIEELQEIIKKKDSYINTLETMIEGNEKRHVEDMKGINLKLDILTESHKEQAAEITEIAKELLWQREAADTWRERLELKMEIDGDTPKKLVAIEKRRKERKKKDTK